MAFTRRFSLCKTIKDLISRYYNTLNTKIDNTSSSLTNLINSKTSGKLGFPNYSARQSRPVNSPWTESANGWIMILHTAYHQGQSCTLTINGVPFTHIPSSGGKHYEDWNVWMVPIAAGSTWQFTMRYVSATIYWMPCL